MAGNSGAAAAQTLSLWAETDGIAEHVRALGGEAVPLGQRDRQPSGAFTTVLVGRFHDRTIMLEEAAPSQAIPAYSARRRQLLEDPKSSIVVFTDASHSCYVWSWTSGRASHTSYHERTVPRGALDAALAAALDEAVEEHSEDGDFSTEVGAAVAAAVIRRLGRAEAAGRRLAAATAAREGSLEDLLCCIEESEEPAALSTLWRVLTGEAPPRSASRDSRSLAVFDPRCGRGEWLLDVLSALAAIYLGCIGRMRGMVEDLDRERGRSRPEKLGGLRRIIEELDAEANSESLPPRIYVRRRIVRANIFAAEPCQDAVDECRRRLLEACCGTAETPAAAGAAAALRVLRGDVEHGCGSRLDVERIAIGAGRAAELADLEAEAGTLGRAATLLRVARWVHGSPESYRAAWGEIDKRRSRLSARLSEMKGAPRCSTAEVEPRDQWIVNRRPLHTWVDFHEVLCDGGFDLVRVPST